MFFSFSYTLYYEKYSDNTTCLEKLLYCINWLLVGPPFVSMIEVHTKTFPQGGVVGAIAAQELQIFSPPGER